MKHPYDTLTNKQLYKLALAILLMKNKKRRQKPPVKIITNKNKYTMKKENNGAPNESVTSELELQRVTSNEMGIQSIDLSQGNLPDLEESQVIPFDLNSDYWSPKLPGETKKVFFDSIKISQAQDINNKDVMIDLECAFFFEKIQGEVKTVRNGSKRLVAILINNNIQRGTPLQIEYLGKKKNSTNSFMSDDWSVKPLMLKIK